MQVSNVIIAVAAETIIALLICTVAFFVYSRKLKALVNRQQETLLALVKAQSDTHAETPSISQAQHYKTHINKELDTTAAQFISDFPEQDIALSLPANSPLTQRILALRYAFLRAEELGTTEERGTTEYWNIFQQALEPLLISNPEHASSARATEADQAPKNSSINRQDLRAADEIAKLRHVAIDQHRIIHELQQKLQNAATTEQKELVIHELQQQLERQIRFAQESEICIKLLEDELAKAHTEISTQEKMLDQSSALNAENQHIKNTLHSFTLESKELISSINELENENDAIKKNLHHSPKTLNTHTTEQESAAIAAQQVQSELSNLQQQYAELEGRYLALTLDQ